MRNFGGQEKLLEASGPVLPAAVGGLMFDVFYLLSVTRVAISLNLFMVSKVYCLADAVCTGGEAACTFCLHYRLLMTGAGGGGSDAQRARRSRQRRRGGEAPASASITSVSRSGAAASAGGDGSASARAAGRGGGVGGRGSSVSADRRGTPKRRAAPTPGHHQPPGQWMAEDSLDWLSRGVSAATIPTVTEALAVAHQRRWPAVIRRMGGWTCVVVPCFADLADEIDQTLLAAGAVAPSRSAPEDTHPGAADESDSSHSDSLNDLFEALEDRNFGVTRLTSGGS